MKDYIIRDNTIALLKKENTTIIYDVENIKVINKNIKTILEENCLFHGCSMKGRIKSISKIINVKYKVPLLISEAENIVLLQLNAIRDKECLFIVANKIINYVEENDYLKIICIDNQEFNVKISKYSFEKMLINTIKLNNYLKWSKFINFV